VVNFGLIGLFAVLTILYILYSPLRKIIDPNNFRITFSIIFLTIILFLKIPLANPSLWFMFALIQYRKEWSIK